MFSIIIFYKSKTLSIRKHDILFFDLSKYLY